MLIRFQRAIGLVVVIRTEADTKKQEDLDKKVKTTWVWKDVLSWELLISSLDI